MNKRFREHYECGKGWDKMIQRVLDYIDNLNNDIDSKDSILVHQIKEKFGGLRIYCNYYPEDLSKVIQEAENESYKTCEICGTKENVGHTTSGWITTCCEKCAEKISSEFPYRKTTWVKNC